jgi:xylan 1,4-beta-xylosidase
MQDYPANAYRNGTMYSSYTAASFAREYDLADYFGINFTGAVTWAFEFEDQPWFNGYRDLATNGVDKPVLNVFRMFGMMSGNRVEVSGDLAYDFIAIRDSSVRGEKTDISALAAIGSNCATIMVWNYHDLNLTGESSPVKIKLKGMPAAKAKLSHYRIDQEYSNSYEAWKEMGSPQDPTDEQYALLEEAGKLKMLHKPQSIKFTDGETIVRINLPRQGVSLLKFEWTNN